MSELTGSRLGEMLHYDPITGEFTWLRSVYRVKRGDLAGSFDKDGYVLIKLDQKTYKAHRLAWLYMTGAWPTDEIDHRDLNKSNNAWANLRAATKSQNMGNISVRSNSQTGVKGVQFDGRRGYYYATIIVDRRKRWLGSFPDAASASAAYSKAATQLRGEFARAS